MWGILVIGTDEKRKKDSTMRSLYSIPVTLIVLSLFTGLFFIGTTAQVSATNASTSISNSSPQSPVVTNPNQSISGICICFDDEYIDEWYSIRPILQKYNAKATFFLCDFDLYTPAQIQELTTLKSDGDELGCHTLRHQDALVYLTNHTMAQYIASEITPAITAMDAKGMHPTDFAYPYGSYSDALDTALTPYFSHVRITSDYNDPEAPDDPSIAMAWYNFNNETVLGAIGMDNIFNVSMDQYYGLMNTVKGNKSVLILYGHETIESTASDYITPPSRLDAILKYAVDNNLTFYTMSDLKTPYTPPAPATYPSPTPTPVPTPTPTPLPANLSGVALTFDDRYISQWSSLESILKKYNATATFDVSEFSQLSPAEIQQLITLKNDGNEIACHGYNHTDAIEYLSNHTMDQYLAYDITPAITAMDANGLHPTDFAYPYGSYNATTNAALLPYFNHLRITSATFPEAYYKFDNSSLIGAVCMDNIFNFTDQQYFDALQTAKQNNEVLVLYADNINQTNESTYVTTPSRIEAILKYASDNNLKFYTLSQLNVPQPSPSPNQTSYIINLKAGWNLISLPLVNNTIMASQLGALGVQRVSAYNTSTGNFSTYVPGFSSADKDFQILPDKAYYVSCLNDTSFNLYGVLNQPHTITVTPGWNVLGWSDLSTVKASDIGNRSTDIQRLCRYNNTTGAYDTYVAGFSSADKNFDVRPGEGYFVYLNSTATEQLNLGGI